MKTVDNLKKKNFWDILTKYNTCRDWLSTITFWKEETGFLQHLIKKYASAITDENQCLELRELHHEISGSLTSQLLWLETKVEAYQLKLKAHFKNDDGLLPEGIFPEHDWLKKEFNSTREQYEELRSTLFGLLKQAVRWQNYQKQVDMAA